MSVVVAAIQLPGRQACICDWRCTGTNSQKHDTYVSRMVLQSHRQASKRCMAQCRGRESEAVPGPILNKHTSVQDLGNNAGPDGAAALAHGEAQARFHGDRRQQLELRGDVVARHDHLCARRQRHRA